MEFAKAILNSADPDGHRRGLLAGSRKTILTAIALGALAFALFSPAIGFDFVNYDDDVYVYANPAVLGGLNASGLRYALTSNAGGSWAPLTWVSYELDTTMLGTRASSYHLTNLLLHVAAGVLLFFALQMMVKSLWTSVVVAGLFLVHPLRCESVVWIAERKDVLCAFFWSLGLVAYGFYVNKPNLTRWSLVFLCFLAGILSKMMIVTFPFVLLLLDYWPLNRLVPGGTGWRVRIWPFIREKIPFFIACGLAVMLGARTQGSLGVLHPVGADVFTKLLRVMENYVFYIETFFWPSHLSILYPTHDVQPVAALLDGLLLAAVTLFAVWQMRRMPWLMVGWFWFLGVLTPVIGFVTFGVLYVANRYTYLPSIGLTLALAALVENLARRFPLARWLGAAAVGAACAVVTEASLPAWRDSFALYTAALRVGPHPAVYNNRGKAFYEVGNLPGALADFSAAIRLEPDFALAYCNRGSVWVDLGNCEAAVKDCTQAIRYAPELADAYNNRGNAWACRGALDKALADYNRAIELAPDRALYYSNRAGTHLRLKQYPQALTDIGHCLRLGGRPQPALVRSLTEARKQKSP